MNRKPILHLFNWDKKFFPPYRDMIREHFPGESHEFIIYGKVDPDYLPNLRGVVVYSDFPNNIIALVRALNNADRIILHGLFSGYLLLILAIQPWLLKKCCWAVWGGDLYAYESKQGGWKWRINKILRKFTIRRFRLITTTVDGDFELVKKWYKTKAVFIQNLMYQSHLARSESTINAKKHEELVVLVGNSADPSNNHKEIIDKLSIIKNINFYVYAPLSYGDGAYRKEIISYGFAKLGNRFKPVTQFMTYLEYDNFLANVDIAIFNHKRQQGMGTTIALLSMGKKVYVRGDVTPWNYFENMGIIVFDSTQEIAITKIDDEISNNNIKITQNKFSLKALLASWAKIFDDGWPYGVL